MSSAGQSNIKGINSQAWAAMSLFLQYLRTPTFLRIELEAPKLADFNLVFEDGHKIICESKDYKRNISFANVRKILNEILRDRQVGEADEILIICSKISKKTMSEIENYKFWGAAKDDFFKSKGYSQGQIDLLPQVRFWEVPATENRTIVYSLFAELLGTWIPQRRLEEKVGSLVIEKIYEKSSKGDKYTRDQFFEEVNEYKKNLIKDSGYFDNERVKLERQLSNIVEAINDNKKPIWAKNQLSALTAQPSKLFFLLDLFKKKTNLKLSEWNDLWESFSVSVYPAHFFEIFKKNLSDDANRSYIIQFVNNNLPKLASFYNARFFEVDSIEICQEIFSLDPTMAREILEITRQVLSSEGRKHFYVKDQQDRNWKREKNAELLRELYCNGNQEVKASVINIVEQSFNLVNDDGKYWLDTPNQIFQILKTFAHEDPSRLILELSKMFVEQYKIDYKRYNSKFKGWELIGSGVSQAGDEYSIEDRHFVTFVLQPIINEFYQEDRATAWAFILEHCIARKSNQVSISKPDFLNRAVIPVLIEEFTKGSDQHTALEILRDFIKMRKGIPSKTEIIFQLVKNAEMSDKKKWQLVEICLNEYKRLPANVFVEQITLYLANKGFKDALHAIAEWYANPNYLKHQEFYGTSVADHVNKLIKQRKTYAAGVNILKAYIASEYFRDKIDSFDIYDVAKCLAQVVQKDITEGLAVLVSLYNSGNPTSNEQSLICSTVHGIDDKRLQQRVYKEFLRPIIDDLSEKNSIEKIFNNVNARETIVQFAEKLARNGMYKEALSISNKFINDSDPKNENEADDPTGQFNYHRQVLDGEETFLITSVRGFICWVLQQLCIPKGEKYIPQVIDLLEMLYRDENLYVRLQVCVPLTELAKRRNMMMGVGDKERFMSKRQARRVEKMAYQMLADSYEITKTGTRPVMLFKSLARVLLNMRDLDSKTALEVIKIFEIEGMEKAARSFVPMLMYYSEFRSLHDKGFDGREFKEITKNIISNCAPAIKQRFAWEFWKVTSDSQANEKQTGLKYDQAFEICYPYLQLLSESYDKESFQDIYRFVEDNLDTRYSECVALWLNCLKIEREFITSNLKVLEANEIHWWPFYYNGKVLKKIFEAGETDRFLEALEFLVDYPPQVSTGDISQAVDILKQFPKSDKNVEVILDKLVERNPFYFQAKQDWLNGQSDNE